MNVFNSVSWATIKSTNHPLVVPESFCRIQESYFRNRMLPYDIEKGEKSYIIVAGVPLSPILELAH